MSRRRRNHYDPGPAIRRRKRLGRWGIGLVVAILAAAFTGERLRLFEHKGSDSERFDHQTFTVVEVVDGDTVRIGAAGGGESTRVRLIGLDAPELRPEGRPPDYWSQEATQALRERAQGRNVIVRLEPLQQRDQYKRLLAYLYIDEAEMLNLAMVREGHAYADRRFRHSHRRQFEQAEDEARKKERGLWKQVRPDQMPAWRQRWLADRGSN